MKNSKLFLAVLTLVISMISLSAVLKPAKTELVNESRAEKIAPQKQEQQPALEAKPEALSAKAIKTLKINPARVVLIKEPIDEYSEKHIDTIMRLGKSSEPIVVLIDSPGGNVLVGEQIVTAMESAHGPVYTVCLKMCASMGAIIHQYGTKRFALDRSVLMFHDASAGTSGRVNEMLSLLEFIKRKLEKTNRYIVSRSKVSYEELMNLEANNYWLDAEEAKEKGFVDELVRIEM
jgi:ATP-dependent Clp protease protease subunit